MPLRGLRIERPPRSDSPTVYHRRRADSPLGEPREIRVSEQN